MSRRPHKLCRVCGADTGSPWAWYCPAHVAERNAAKAEARRAEWRRAREAGAEPAVGRPKKEAT